MSKRDYYFIHGCFWHSHGGCALASKPKSNRSYWIRKLQGNKARDSVKLRALRAAGYRVLVVWECDVRDGSRMRDALNAFFCWR